MRSFLFNYLPIALVILLLLTATATMAQNTQKGFSFQGYARDFSGAAYSSTAITAQFSIYPEGESVAYTEQHSLTTDAYGVFHATIGSVTPVNFATIDFSAKKYFVKAEVKVTGGDFVTIADTEFLAVPYAKAAQNAVNSQNAVNADNGNPVGTVISFAGPVAPTGYIICDGSSVTVAAYPALYAAIGDAWGGDGGTNFNLPDLRGQFLRGKDAGQAVDPDAATRTALYSGGNTGDAVGSFQGDTLQSHRHNVYAGAAGVLVNHSGTYWVSQINGLTELTGGNETRPTNAYVLYVIKY